MGVEPVQHWKAPQQAQLQTARAAPLAANGAKSGLKPFLQVSFNARVQLLASPKQWDQLVCFSLSFQTGEALMKA